MTDKILILGKSGQVAKALAALLGERATSLDSSQLDLRQADFTGKLDGIISTRHFSAVINAAAYTQVDKAEGEGKADAMRINGTAVGELAAWCKQHQLPLIHYSTDYVLDGRGDTAHIESETPHPLNIYGASKLVGERAIAEAGGDYLIFRTSWVYDAEGKNFFTTIRRLIREKEILNVIADQIGAPTYAAHLAQATLTALEKAHAMKPFPTGLYHLCNSGETSWHGFAQAIYAHDKARSNNITCKAIHPIPATQYPLPAPRPMNSRLDCTHAKEVLGVMMPAWQQGLAECFDGLQ